MSETDQSLLRRRVALVGVGATRQGDHGDVDEYRLIVDALREALDDAGLEKGDLDGLLGWRLRGTGSDPVVLAKLIGLNPRVTGFLDYTSGGFAIQYAAMLIATGVCEVVACTFGRNPAGSMVDYSGGVPYDETHGLINAGAIAALGWTRHMAKYGSTEEALGHVAVAARRHAQMNPNAAFREPLELDDFLASDYVVAPFRDLDICKLTAGGAAVILTSAARAATLRKPPVLIESVGRQQAMRKLEDEDHLLCVGMRSAAKQCFDAAGMAPDDVDVLGISDASTAAVVHTLENYGFCEEGGGPDLVADGGIELGGKLPVNTDGGQLSGGYLIGWLHQVELVRQLRGECGDRQVPDARVGMYTTTGRYRQDYLSMIYTAA